MDHHCPVLGECVGLGNHQKFMVMLVWGSILSLYGTLFLLNLKVKPGTQHMFKLALSGVALSLFVCTLGFYISQLYMISKNVTTIEQIGKEPNIYNQGFKKNIQQIFGTSFIWFFIPRKDPFITGFEYVKIKQEWEMQKQLNEAIDNILSTENMIFKEVP